jgi:hypothetical protein
MQTAALSSLVPYFAGLARNAAQARAVSVITSVVAGHQTQSWPRACTSPTVIAAKRCKRTASAGRVVEHRQAESQSMVRASRGSAAPGSVSVVVRSVHVSARSGAVRGHRTKEHPLVRSGCHGQNPLTPQCAGCRRQSSAGRARANPSLKRSANGMPPGPGWRYAVHFRHPGPGVLPLAPA